MEREGKRKAEAMKYKTEDEAASRGMRMFLGCSKKRNDSLTENLLLKAKTWRKLESDDRTTGRTLELDSPKLSNMLCGGKRRQEGGLDSPSKRAKTFCDLKKFGGEGVAAPNIVSQPSKMHSPFMHATHGPEERLHSLDRNKSDDNLMKLGLMEEGKKSESKPTL